MESLISQGFSLMIYGMGFVFVFLTLLVGITKLMSKVAVKFEPEAIPQAKPRSKAAPAGQPSQNNDELVAVMTAAVHKFRS
ncbi:MAG: OadG family protein [Pseudomonadales bacterium]